MANFVYCSIYTAVHVPLKSIEWYTWLTGGEGLSLCKNERFNQLIDKTCEKINSTQNVTEMKEFYQDLKQMDSKNITFLHNISFPEIPDILKYKSLAKKIYFYANIGKDYTKMTANICRQLLVVAFLFVLFSSKSYHNKYLKEIHFDNNYITNYFKRIDARRKKAVNI